MGGKADALKLALDWAVTGDDATRGTVRPAADPCADGPDPDARHVLASYVNRLCRNRLATGAGGTGAAPATGRDADLAALAAQREADHLRGMTMLTARLVELDCLREDVTPAEAAAVLTTLATVGSYHHLVHQCGWTVQRFETWLTDTLVATLIAPDYRPETDR